jgi:nucleotide-binding universal stress UspA family protein
MDAGSGPVVCGLGDRDVGYGVAAFAAGLAEALGARLTLVRAESMVELGRSSAALQRGHARLADVLSPAKREHEAATRTVKLGDPGTALVVVAAESRAQLLVVGAGRSAAPPAAVSREVAMRARCPVIMVPRAPTAPRTHKWHHRHVLCAFDGSAAARVTLGVAARFAERVGAAAFVAHVSPGSLHELGARAQAEEAALIVAPSYALEGLHSTLPRSKQDASALSGPIPLLLVPPAYRPRAGLPVRVAAAI